MEDKTKWFFIYTNKSDDGQISLPCASLDTAIAVKTELKELGYVCSEPFSTDNYAIIIALLNLRRKG